LIVISYQLSVETHSLLSRSHAGVNGRHAERIDD
jgi:hypothetical protein